LKLPMRISVVIPTRNRPRAAEACLDALAAQTLPTGSFEVIVVDDGSEPPLTLDPKRWAAKFDLKLIRHPNTGPAGARNRGVAEARGEFLAFTDDDCLPAPTWLEKLVNALRRNPEALVGGSTFNGLKNDLFAETSQLIVEMVYEHFNRDPANAYFFASNNMACLKNCFSKLGGFDVAFPWAGAEDREFCDRWRIQKWPLFWEQTARIEHRHAQSLSRFLRLYWRYGQGAFLYHAKRNKRASGTMADDLGFHRNLPKVVLAKISSYPFAKRPQLLVALMLWQIANAMGFFYEMARSPKNSKTLPSQ
jgi:glycosyltransferase involved in cell wall biosynthesis